MSRSKKSNILWTIAATCLLIAALVYLKQAYRKPAIAIATEIVKKDTVKVEEPDVEIKPILKTSIADSIIELGMLHLGTPYVAAGNGEVGFDCSGFVHFVFKQFNIQVPRSSIEFDQFGTEVAIEQVQKGDILLFLSPTRNEIGHVGIVSEPDGLKSNFIHASSGEAMGVTVSSLTTKGYADRIVKAIRVLD